MDASNMILPTLLALLIQSPILLVWLVGFILVTIYWRRHPRVSLLTVIALAVFFLETLVSTYLSMSLPLTLSRQGMEITQIGQILGVINLVTSIVVAIAWGLVVAAIFSGRKSTEVASNDVGMSPVSTQLLGTPTNTKRTD